MSTTPENTPVPDTPPPPPPISLQLCLDQNIKIAKLEKEKIALLDKIAQLNRQLLYAGIGINLTDFEES